MILAFLSDQAAFCARHEFCCVSRGSHGNRPGLQGLLAPAGCAC